MRRTSIAVLAGVAALSLAACGDTMGEQALYGAGTGAAASAILDGNLVTGAVVGAGANVLYCRENPGKC